MKQTLSAQWKQNLVAIATVLPISALLTASTLMWQDQQADAAKLARLTRDVRQIVAVQNTLTQTRQRWQSMH